MQSSSNDPPRGVRLWRLAASGTVVAVLAGGGLAGCGSDSKSSDPASTTSTSKASAGDVKVFTQSSGELDVTAGEQFVIAVESNPSTGFAWTVAQAPDAGVVTLEGQTYEKSDSGALGAPGTERFTFKAVGAGTTTIALEYARPSDPDSPDNTTDTYTVTVS